MGGGLDTAILAMYSFFALISGGNALGMARARNQPNPLVDPADFLVLIPARNEAHNLARLLPNLVAQVRTVVFDDESEDETARVARGCGAEVIGATETLPKGWAGKNWACYQLAQYAQTTPATFWIFLDADTELSKEFLAGVGAFAKPDRVLTAFARVVPGDFPEPIFLGWVGWILLSTNPFFLVYQSQRGHNRFTNGQFTCWPREVYMQLQPNQAVKGAMLEDVKIGRYLAKSQVKCDVINASDVMKVHMYKSWRDALDGLSKNSFEILGSYSATIALSMCMLWFGWGWLFCTTREFALVCLGLLCLSMFNVVATVDKPNWVSTIGCILSPLIVSIGGFTMLRSAWWKRSGKTEWKGRIYP